MMMVERSQDAEWEDPDGDRPKLVTHCSVVKSFLHKTNSRQFAEFESQIGLITAREQVGTRRCLSGLDVGRTRLVVVGFASFPPARSTSNAVYHVVCAHLLQLVMSRTDSTSLPLRSSYYCIL